MLPRKTPLMACCISNAPASGLRPSQAQPARLQCSGLPPAPVAGGACSSPMLRPRARARRRGCLLLLLHNPDLRAFAPLPAGPVLRVAFLGEGELAERSVEV